MRIFFRNNLAKLHLDSIWKDEAWGFLKKSSQEEEEQYYLGLVWDICAILAKESFRLYLESIVLEENKPNIELSISSHRWSCPHGRVYAVGGISLARQYTVDGYIVHGCTWDYVRRRRNTVANQVRVCHVTEIELTNHIHHYIISIIVIVIVNKDNNNNNNNN